MNKRFNKALQYHQSGKLAHAEREYRKALKESPRDINVLYHLGVVLHQQSKIPQAKEILIKVVSMAPDFPEAHFSLGTVLMEAGENDQAENEFRVALSLRQDMYGALLRLGELLVIKEKYEEAVSFLTRACQLNGNDVKPRDALAQSYKRLGHLEEAVKAARRALELEGNEQRHSIMADIIYMLFRQEPELSRKYARQWVDDFPESAFVQHVGVAILGDATPERANDQYLINLFDSFSSTFEEQLTKIGYSPSDIISHAIGLDYAKKDLLVLDAGCGTGMAGKYLSPMASQLVGVDISHGMLAKAREKHLYDELYEMELLTYLEDVHARFDLIYAADLLIYIGDLQAFMELISEALSAGGKIVCTIESDDEVNDFRLGPHGRYSHSKEYVLNLIKKVGLDLQVMKDFVLRKEFGTEVKGYVVVAQKP